MIGYSINCSWFIKLNSVQYTTQLHMYSTEAYHDANLALFISLSMDLGSRSF